MRKLTLSAEEDVIRGAKRLARANRTSVSAMFNRLIRFMCRRREGEPETPGPLTLKASGVAALPKGREERAVLEDALLERHKLDR
ncbi:MAG: hypothetical protein HY763_11620 [Planctomycetes bacterium]|nr:hypothetical protein [Planctomycetota bacterium]